jgi:hypothetical protein
MPSSRIANPVTSHVLPFDGNSPFHFANRASISLRTPKHVFHSFGIFTVAAMIPLPKSPMRDDRNSFMISDSWYIGAFGKWWRGGILETWYQDVISRSKDEESWRSGILNMKSLDMLKDFAGMILVVPSVESYLTGSHQVLLRNWVFLMVSSMAPHQSCATANAQHAGILLLRHAVYLHLHYLNLPLYPFILLGFFQRLLNGQ